MLEGGGGGHAVLCDFGASFTYPDAAAAFFEAMEARAFGLLLADLVARVDDAADGGADGARAARLGELAAACTGAPGGRPRFAALEAELAALAR